MTGFATQPAVGIVHFFLFIHKTLSVNDELHMDVQFEGRIILWVLSREKFRVWVMSSRVLYSQSWWFYRLGRSRRGLLLLLV